MIKLFKNYLFVYRFIALRLMQSYVFFRNQTTFATILPQISLCLGGASHRLHGSAQNCLLSGASHRLHRFTQMLLTSGGALVSSAPTKQTVVLPQISRIYTELLVGDVLPQNTQNSQKLLLSGASHRFHRSTQMLLTSGGALVSSAPTKQEVHQPSKQWFSHRLHRSTQNCLLGMFSHRFHRFTQKLLILGGIKTRKRHAPKGQKHIAQGNALGILYL